MALGPRLHSLRSPYDGFDYTTERVSKLGPEMTILLPPLRLVRSYELPPVICALAITLAFRLQKVIVLNFNFIGKFDS